MKSVFDVRHTMYIICLWRISESLGFIWSIPPICSCTDYNISKSNNIIIMIHIYIYIYIRFIIININNNILIINIDSLEKRL